MKLFSKIKETYYHKKIKYQKLKELRNQLGQINALIKALDEPQHKESKVNTGVLKQGNLADLRGVRDVTGSVQDDET